MLDGQVQRRDDLHVVLDDRLAGLGQLAVAARLAGEVDDHRARLHPFDGLRRDQLRRRATRHERRRDDDVEALDRVGQRLLLLRALLVGQLARVAALAAGLEAEVEPLRAERLRPARRPPGARRSRSCARPGAWPSRAPAAPPRRRRARAPSPAGSCPRRSSASGRSGPSPRRRAAPPCSRATLLCEDSASIDCAREMRGIASIANAVAPASASACVVCGLDSGARKPIRIEPWPSARICSRVRRRDRQHHVRAPHLARVLRQLRARLREGRVGQRARPCPRRSARHVEALALELAHDLGHERHPVLARRRLLRNADAHEGRERIRSRRHPVCRSATGARRAYHRDRRPAAGPQP